MDLSENEKALYAELVVQIAVRMGQVRIDRSADENKARKDRFDIKGRIIEHGFWTIFEIGCRVLSNLRIVHPLNTDGTPHEDPDAWAVNFRIRVDLPELRKYLAGPLPESAPTLSDVIVSFLWLTTDFGQQVSTRRESFPVSPDFPRVFDLFARCGYVERVGEAVKWTAKIAPEMRAIYAWNEDNISCKELYDAEIDKMWRTMPVKFRDAFFSGGPVDVVSLSAVISHFWYGGEWQDTDRYDDNGRITLSGGAPGKAKDLVRKFRETGG